MIRIKKDADWAKVAHNLRAHFKSYLQQNSLKSVVLGESGGIDSALTSALVRPVCDELGIKFIGRSISIETNTLEEQKRAHNIGIAFCHDFRNVDLTDLYKMTKATIEESDDEDYNSVAYRLRMGNIKARLRMIYLYNLAQKHCGMVLSTDNHTEYMLGFWTLHGDVGDYNPLFGLWKTEVYLLSKHIADYLEDAAQRDSLIECINCIPTDGLGITSSDVEQLGAQNYSEVDRALVGFLYEGKNEINEKVINRHKSSEFKRLNPIFITRQQTFKGCE